MPDATDVNRPATDNGAPSLSDRVRSLRLADRAAARRAGPRGGALPWVLCVIFLLTSVAFGYRAYRVRPAPADAEAEESPGRVVSPADVGTTPATASTGKVVLPAKGYVVPVHPIQVSPKVGGQLVWIHPDLEEGKLFREGQILARLEDVDYRADRDAAFHAFCAAQDRWLEARVNFDLQKLEVELAEKDLDVARADDRNARYNYDKGRRTAAVPGAVTGIEMSKLDSDAKSASARLKAAQARLLRAQRAPVAQRLAATEGDMEQALHNLRKAQWKLDNTLIRAPVTGTILSKRAERGNIVNPGAFSTGSTGGIAASLCDMADLRDIEIEVFVQERDVANVVVGQKALVMPEPFKGHKPFLAKHPNGYEGFVSRLMPTADRAKGAVPVRVRIPRESIPPDEAGFYLKPDTGAEVSFLAGDDGQK